jgi:hypothetical protein
MEAVAKAGHLVGEQQKAKGSGAKVTERAYDEARRCAAPPAERRLRLQAERREATMEQRMKYRLGLSSCATGALVLAAVSACAFGNSEPANPTTSSPSATATPSAPETSARPTSPSEAAVSGARRTVRQYFSTIDQLAQNPSANLKALGAVMTSTELNAEKKFLRDQHRRGERQVGDTRLADVKVQSVTLNNSDPAAGKVPTVVVDVCWDVSKVDVLDKSGKSIVSPNRPDTGWTRYTVANYEYAADPTGGWRVATGQDLKQTTCAAF